MASLDLSVFASPVSETAPCGSDLEEEGDLEYMNFFAAAEGRLPTSYFSFDRGAYDFGADFTNVEKFSADTRDLRLLVLAAKLCILNRNLSEFTGVIQVIATSLSEHWEDIHPKPFDGDYIFRMVALNSLDDNPVSILPLTYAPLVQSRTLGPISYRSKMVADGDASARDGEPTPSHADIQRAISEGGDDLEETRETVRNLKNAVSSIRKTVMEHLGFDSGLSLDKLKETVEAIAEMLGIREEIAVSEETETSESSEPSDTPAAGAPSSGANPAMMAALQQITIPAGAVSSQAIAAAALQAIDGYFGRKEPSSPAIMLVRQARRLVGKSFVEALEILAPQRVKDAILQVGGDNSFVMPSNYLIALSERQELGEPEDEDIPDFNVETRADAVQLMSEVESFYRAAEPSSAIPLLLTRAKTFASKDFVALLSDFLPSQSEEEAAASLAAAAAAPGPKVETLAAAKPAAAKAAPGAGQQPLSKAEERRKRRNDPETLRLVKEQNERKERERRLARGEPVDDEPSTDISGDEDADPDNAHSENANL